ncbi:hypothetical protein MSPP1_003943 [Malassezia sp. CBS 17886]|nr:hypothetical protein MSPP1_003943 [Malassezia sp. CBS 17886]
MDVDAAGVSGARPPRGAGVCGAAASPCGRGHKRSHSLLSDTASTTSDSSMDDCTALPWAHHAKRRPRRNRTPSLPHAAGPTDEVCQWADTWRSASASPQLSGRTASPTAAEDARAMDEDDVDAGALQVPPGLRVRTQGVPYAPPTPSPLTLSRLSMEERPRAAHEYPAPDARTGRACTPVSARTQLRGYSPGVRPQDLPSGGKQLLRYTMGFRDDCDLCRRRTPGHYTHMVPR